MDSGTIMALVGLFIIFVLGPIIDEIESYQMLRIYRKSYEKNK